MDAVFARRARSGKSLEELMGGLTRCGDVRTLDEPVPKISSVANGNTRSEPCGQDAVCQQPEEGFMFTHKGHLRWRLGSLRLLKNAAEIHCFLLIYVNCSVQWAVLIMRKVEGDCQCGTP